MKSSKNIFKMANVLLNKKYIRLKSEQIKLRNILSNKNDCTTPAQTSENLYYYDSSIGHH